MNTLTKKLGLAVLVGLVIVALTWGLAPAEQRPHLLLDALKHLGVIVIGIAAVEVVWAWAGGSPTELDLKNLIDLNKQLSTKVGEDVDALRKSSAEIKETSTRIEESVQRMTTIVRAAHRTGLTNVGAVQDELGYAPGRFADELGRARNGIDLCGCMLAFLYSTTPCSRRWSGHRIAACRFASCCRLRRANIWWQRSRIDLKSRSGRDRAR